MSMRAKVVASREAAPCLKAEAAHASRRYGARAGLHCCVLGVSRRVELVTLVVTVALYILRWAESRPCVVRAGLPVPRIET